MTVWLFRQCRKCGGDMYLDKEPYDSTPYIQCLQCGHREEVTKMASPNLQAVKLEGTESRIRKMARHVDNRATVVVRGPKGVLFVAVPGSELGWLDKVAKDTGCKKQEIAEMPKYETALCGILTINKRWHEPNCSACKKLRPKAEEKPERPRRTTGSRSSRAKTMIKVEGLHDLTFEGLVNFMRNRMDESLALASEYDTVLKALEKIPELESQLNKYQTELGSHKDALRYFAGIK